MPSVNEALEGYLAGRVKAERLVEVVTAAYYGERGAGSGALKDTERLRRIMDVIERAHPGVVELAGSADRPGYVVRVKDRPFPKEYDAALRAAVEGTAVGTPEPAPRSPHPAPGVWARLGAAVRRLFSASA